MAAAGVGGQAGGLLSAAPLSGRPGPAPAACPPSAPSSLSAAPAAVPLQRSRWAPRTGRSATSTSRSTGSRVRGASRGGRGRGWAGAGRGREGRAPPARAAEPPRSRAGQLPSAVPREPSLECPGSRRRGPADRTAGAGSTAPGSQPRSPRAVMFALRESGVPPLIPRRGTVYREVAAHIRAHTCKDACVEHERACGCGVVNWRCVVCATEHARDSQETMSSGSTVVTEAGLPLRFTSCGKETGSKGFVLARRGQRKGHLEKMTFE